MCLLLWKPAHVTLTKRDVYDYVKHNPDGFGIAWHGENGQVNTYKMVGGKKAVWRAYQQYAQGRDCALHWRMATSGNINLDMTHPFDVTDGIVMMHNGVLACKSTAKRSDTWHFAKIMRRELERHPDRLDDPEYIDALDKVIGSGNRLLFMRDGKPEPVIVGKQKGIEHNGCWYSNCYAWTNDYYDENDWLRYCSGGWGWDDDDASKPTLLKDTTFAFPADSSSSVGGQHFYPATGREIACVNDVERWLVDYPYADPEQVVEYFVEWHARVDHPEDKVRLRAVCDHHISTR